MSKKPPSKRPPAATIEERTRRTRNELIDLTPEICDSWQLPDCQRPLKITTKVYAIAAKIKAEGVIPGVITIARIIGDPAETNYLPDGQHRRAAFRLSGLTSALCEVRCMVFNSMDEIAIEFDERNDSIVRVTSDDRLHALEGRKEGLAHIRQHCPFVGYSHVRQGQSPTKLSMSQALRCWYGSEPDAPRSAPDVMTLARNSTLDDMKLLATFLNMASKAWGFDAEYVRLWGSLNLTLCMWLYRRLVVSPWSARTKSITEAQFSKCLMSLSTDSHYLDWLVGRNTVSKRDRSPCFNRIKEDFAKRLEADTGKKHLLPKPPWLT